MKILCMFGLHNWGLFSVVNTYSISHSEMHDVKTGSACEQVRTCKCCGLSQFRIDSTYV